LRWVDRTLILQEVIRGRRQIKAWSMGSTEAAMPHPVDTDQFAIIGKENNFRSPDIVDFRD
jgi:hypothetical protein